MNKRKEHLFVELAKVCRGRNSKKLADVIQENGNILDLRDGDGRTLLHYCTEHDHTSCADQILTRRPDLLTLQDQDGLTVLHLASISGNSILIKFFLEEGKRLLKGDRFHHFLNCFDHENHTALHWATVSGELSCLKQLHEAGADPSLPDIHGAHPIHYAAQNSQPRSKAQQSLQVLKEIIAFAPSEKESRDRDGRTPLIWAASSGNTEAVMALLSAKVDTTQQDKDGLTALHCSASRGFQDCLECLTDLGGTVVDQMDSNGCTALFYAVTLGHADCVQFLLRRGAEANHQDRKGRTAAHCGAAKGQLETLRILLQRGGNLWLRNIQGDLPLHEAVRSGRKELVIWLLEHRSSSVDLSNTMGKTPLHVACVENNVEICKVLLDFGSDVNSVMKMKGLVMTPLDVCLQKGFRSCAKYLLLHGALPSSKLTDYRRSNAVANKKDSGPESGGYSSSLGSQGRDLAFENTVAHLTSQSESSHSFSEVRLPSRLKAHSTISHKVQVFSENPVSPESMISVNELDSRNHTMITNVYVNAYPHPRKRLLKKIKRRKSKSRCSSVEKLAIGSGVDIWRAEDQENSRHSLLEENEAGRHEDESGDHATTSSSQESEQATRSPFPPALNVPVDDHTAVSRSSSNFGDHSGRSDSLDRGDNNLTPPGTGIDVGHDESNELQNEVTDPDHAEKSVDDHADADIAPETVDKDIGSDRNSVNDLRDQEDHAQPPESRTEIASLSHEQLTDAENEENESDKQKLPPDEANQEVNDASHDAEESDNHFERNEDDLVEDTDGKIRRKRGIDDEIVVQDTIAASPIDEEEIKDQVDTGHDGETDVSDKPDTSMQVLGAPESVVTDSPDLQIDVLTVKHEASPDAASLEIEIPDRGALSLIREVSERTDKPELQQPQIENEFEQLQENVADMNNNNMNVSPPKIQKKHGVSIAKQSAAKNRTSRRGEWKRGPAIVSTPPIRKSAPKNVPDDAGDQVSTADTLHELTSLDTDDSLRDSVSVGEPDIAAKDEVVFNLRSGEKIRATTTFQLQAAETEDREVRFNTVPRAKHRSRSTSKCSHKLHRKPSISHVPPLDLANVKSRIDTRPPESFLMKHSSPAFVKEDTTNIKKLAAQLSKSSKKYAVERKLFEELQDLKRCQMRANRSHEAVLVKKLVDHHNSDIIYPGLDSYSGLFEFSSFETFLYEQLRRLSRSSPDRVRSSSEENMHRLQIEHNLTGKSLSAEVLMSRPRFQTRFLDLEDNRDTIKPCICGLMTRTETTKNHRRSMSDVVKTETSLNYGIITRAPKQQSLLFPAFMDKKCIPHVTCQRDKRSTVTAALLQTSAITDSKVSLNDRPANPVGVKIVAAKADLPDNQKTKSRTRIGMKSAEKIRVDEESISRRWKPIKSEERQKRRSSGDNGSDVILLYEVSTRRKSATHSLSDIQKHQMSRPMSRTMSDSVILDGKIT